MRLEDALVELKYTKDWTPKTTRWYRERLGAFVRWCNEQHITELEQLTAPLIRRYIAYVQTRPSEKSGQPLDSFTVHSHVRAIRTLLFWAASEELIDEHLPKKIKLTKCEQKVLKILEDKQLDLLFAAAKKTQAPLRDTALVALLLDTGCRASELCGLTLDDVHFDHDAVWLLVHGKGRKDRPVGLGKRSGMALHRYIKRERRSDLPYVFIGKRGQLKPSGLDQLLYRLKEAAGAQHFEGVSVGAHRWRHTHAVMSLEAGTDVYVLSKQMGHADIGVTTNYLTRCASCFRQLTERDATVGCRG
jgi:site-specific recombinase XerD